MGGINVVQVLINDTSDKVITGRIEYDRANGGILVIPSGSSLPSTPSAGEIFWNISDNNIYRRSDDNTQWNVLSASANPNSTLSGHVTGTLSNTTVINFTLPNQAQGTLAFFSGSQWYALPTSASGSVLTQDSTYPVWDQRQFGRFYWNATSYGLSSTTSTSYINKCVLTASNLQSGTYRVNSVYNWGYTSTARNFLSRLMLNGTQMLGNNVSRPTGAGTDQAYPSSMFSVLTLSGTNVFTLEFAATNVSDSARISSASIDLWRVL